MEICRGFSAYKTINSLICMLTLFAEHRRPSPRDLISHINPRRQPLPIFFIDLFPPRYVYLAQHEGM